MFLRDVLKAIGMPVEAWMTQNNCAQKQDTQAPYKRGEIHCSYRSPVSPVSTPPRLGTHQITASHFGLVLLAADVDRLDVANPVDRRDNRIAPLD